MMVIRDKRIDANLAKFPKNALYLPYTCAIILFI